MAPNGHAASESRAADRPSQNNSRSPWLKKHGSVEFRAWQKEHPAQSLTKEEWQNSKHVDGLSLYYAALQIWDEPDSSDDEVEQVQDEARSRGVRVGSAREPKNALKTNGSGLARSMGSATPSASAQTDDLSPSAKKKRKARKKYLSQELVASEESEGVEAATPIVQATAPSAPIITVNGRRKSSNRKPRKKPISEEKVSPEDEEENPMEMNGISTPAIASPLPVRSAPRPPTIEQVLEPPKKTILKLSTRKAPKKKVLSEETVLEDDTDEGKATAAAVPSTIAAVSEPNIAPTTEEHTSLETDTAGIQNGGTPSPDPASESASAAATRRGLRARRPAQQRPYSYDAQIFEEQDDEEVPEEEIVVQPSPVVQSRRVSVASIGKSYAEAHQLDEETLAILQGEVDPEPDENFRRSKHFKGKGRAWKKEESDEDLEFNPSKKKARAKARAKALLQQNQAPKKRGRPKKSVLSEDIIRDDSDEDSTMMTEDASPSPPVWEAPAKKTRNPVRKSTLSSTLVIDDSENEQDQDKSEPATKTDRLPEVSTPVSKKRGRPRKSDQSAGAGTPAGSKDVIEADVSHTPKGTPKKSYTPKGEPKSYTPKGEPKQVSDVDSADMDISDSSDLESDADNHVSERPSDIEAFMASVNADDDDDEELCK